MPSSRMAIALVWAAALVAQPAQVQILAPASRLLAGETLPLTAVVRDAAGNLVRNTVVEWSTNPPVATLATIDANGRLTGRTLGVVVVRASVPNGPSVETPFQILPLRVAISPTNAELPLGSTRQFVAVAYDKDDRVLPGVEFEWSVAGLGYEGAPPNPYLEVSRTGLVAGRYEGTAYVRASFPYSLANAGLPLNMTARLVAQALVRVTGPRDFQVRTVYSSARNTPPVTELRYRPSLLWPAPDGSLYFNASLGSVGNGLLRWKNGVIEPVQLGGQASTTGGSVVLDVDQHAINAQGDMLSFEVSTDGNRIQRGGAGGFQPMLVNNIPAAEVDFIGGFSLTRHSLNRYGQFLFRAGYRDRLTRQFRPGLFRGSGLGVDELLLAGDEQLPDLPPGNFNIDWGHFGLTDNSVAFYRVSVPGKLVIYRQENGRRTKMIATGDAFLGSTVTALLGPPDGAPAQGFFVTPGGELLVGLQLADGRSLLARFPEAEGAAVEVLALAWSAAGVLDDHPEYGTLVFGAFENQLRVVRWKRGQPPETLLVPGEASLAGTTIESVFSGAFGPQGEIYLLVRGGNARMIGMELRPTERVLFQSGDRLNFPAPPVFTGFASARTGPLQLFTGGAAGSASVSEWSAGAFRPVLATGDTLGRNSIYSGGTPFGYARTRSGQVYTLVPWVGSGRDFGIARLRADRSTELLYPFNLRIDGVEHFQPYRLLANDRGDLLWQTGTPRGDQRLVFTRNGQHRVILTDNGDPAAPTVIDGLHVLGIDNLVMDEGGRALALVRFRERFAQSLIAWDGERWQRIIGIGETEMERRRVTSIGLLRAAGNRLMAHVYFEGQSSIVEWTAAGLQTVIRSSDPTPLGYVVNWVATFDINSQGHIAFVCGFPEGGQGVFVRRGEQTYTVMNTARPLDGGELLMGINMLELRDDGMVYVMALNARSESLLIEAQPR